MYRFNHTKLAPVSAPAIGSAALAGQRQNSENTELYSIQPFRLYGVGKPGLSLARQTYAERLSHCNIGWCQDIIQAASLGLMDEATDLLIERAAIGPVISGCLVGGQAGCTKWDPKGHGSFRFRGFTPDAEAGGNQVRFEAIIWRFWTCTLLCSFALSVLSPSLSFFALIVRSTKRSAQQQPTQRDAVRSQQNAARYALNSRMDEDLEMTLDDCSIL